MLKYYKLPLAFLVLAGLLGLFLRWQVILPTPGIRYTWVLHSHSHVMFLGWVFNVLYLAFIQHHIPENARKGYIRFFVALQALVIAMMISFPMQGYGLYSIIFTTLHTIAIMIFIPVFLRTTKRENSVSLWFARIALIFFFISTAGPFGLAYLMANKLGQTVWSQFSIYYYLHFQYNGFFLFGIFSLFFRLLESKKIAFDQKSVKTFGTWMAIACIPAYTLSILFADPGLIFNIVGGVAGIIQLIAISILALELKRIKKLIKMNFSKMAVFLFCLILGALFLKSLLQLVSAEPEMARLAYSMRPVVIAYLHLVLVGVITLFLLTWYLETGLVKRSTATRGIVALLIGFIGSEICLTLIPWWNAIIGSQISSGILIFVFSVLMVTGFLVFYFACWRKHPMFSGS